MLKLNFFLFSFSAVNQYDLSQIKAFCTCFTYSFSVHKMFSVYLSFALKYGTSMM